MGLLEVTSYEEQTVELCAGDLLCFYSDGINDILNAEGEFFGERRIEDLLVRHQEKSVQEILSEIFQMVRSFTGPGTPRDDQTLMLLKVL